MSKLESGRTRITMVVIASLTTFTLIAFVFAFLQQAEAKRQAQISVELVKKAASIEEELQKCRLANQSPY
jgi:hypothetical protein